METKTRKSSPRLSVPPPGILAFADGGAVRPETADELMARMTAKYGAPSAGKVQAEAAQPVPQPQPKAQPAPQPQGIIGILKGRKEAIDKAAGYAEGGKIKGPGTAKSDSIPATVRETGEGIQVSNGERIVSVEQGKFLDTVARNAGYEGLDHMFKDAGLPVGPAIKGGKRAAADGMAPETDPDTDGRRQYSPTYSAAFANRGDSPSITSGLDDRVKAAIAAPPTLGGTVARTEPAGGALSNPAAGGITIDPFGPKPEKLGSGLAGADTQFNPMGGQQPAKPGRDTSGIITAESAQAAAGVDMQRSGGISGDIDMAGVNDILARENKIRGEMQDMKDAGNRLNSGTGVAILGGDGPTEAEKINAERTNRWAIDDLRDSMKRAGTRTERAALGQALNQTIAGQNQGWAETIRQQGITHGQDLSHAAEINRQGIVARGQDLATQRAIDRNDTIARGQDIRADTAASRINSNEAIAKDRAQRIGQPTLAQQRGNAEIDAARERLAGMDAAEIKRRTANFTATGRENPDYDPTLAKAASLANRRKIGDDQHFDERQQPPTANQFGFDRAEVAGRFRSERGMDRYKLGNDTENGVEVLDGAGKVIGHYR